MHLPHGSSAPHVGFASIAELPEITVSVLKNKFSDVARLAAREPLAVSRHNRREYVILTAEQYEELQQSRRAPLENLAAEFDQLVTRMNTPKAKRAAASLFSATSAQLGKAAQKARRSSARA
jgi:antitoxin Phd